MFPSRARRGQGRTARPTRSTSPTRSATSRCWCSSRSASRCPVGAPVASGCCSASAIAVTAVRRHDLRVPGSQREHTSKAGSSTRCGPLSMALIALAAWQPTRRAPRRRRRPSSTRSCCRRLRQRSRSALLVTATIERAHAAGRRAGRERTRRGRPAGDADLPRERADAAARDAADAFTDALTGLGNRRRLMRRPRAGIRAQRAPAPARRSRSSTSTASSATTTASATAPAMRCCEGSAGASRRRSAITARPTASAATSSASCWTARYDRERRVGGACRASARRAAEAASRSRPRAASSLVPAEADTRRARR